MVRNVPTVTMHIAATVLTAAAALCASASLEAQRPVRSNDPQQAQLMSELAQLRQAASFETAGNLREAERIVTGILESNPSSLSALLTMERLLNAQGRQAEILPVIDRLLREDPKSVIGHQTRVRVAADLGDAARLDLAIAEWIRATPQLETPYRESALVLRRRGDVSRGIQLLEEGRKRIDRPDALALELGDAYAANRNPTRAADEWSRAVGTAGRGFLLVQRRLQSLPDGGASVIPALVERLRTAPTTLPRLRAGALLAIDAGLGPAASRVVNDIASATPVTDRQQVLIELARRADGADLPAVALQLYRNLIAIATDSTGMLALRTRVAELALVTGDTTLAAETYRYLESATAAGSPQRRQAVALRIQLAARDGDVNAALADYETFRAEFTNAPELDAVAAALGERLMSDGDVERAERALTGVVGPRSSQLRGLVYLRRGDIDGARNEMIAAASLLRGNAATESIAIATLLSRVSARGGEIVARIVAAPEADRVAQIRSAAEQARELPARERGAVLDFLADAADDVGAQGEAVALRREIVATLPHSNEAPAALLELATQFSTDPERADEARVLLETLIVEYPRSALAPQARAALERLKQH